MPPADTPTLVSAAPRAVDIRAAILDGRLSAEAALERTLERIRAVEPQLHAWAHLDPAAARERARAVDRALAAGARPGLLAGVPIAIKDIFDTADMPTGYGSAVYEGHRPAQDAEVVRRAAAEGAVAVGKSVTTELAYFTPGPTANPWHLGHTPGGSSSGSAVAVASGMVPVALGSQTAGSLVRPASYCGVFGFKPTYGSVPTAGTKPFSHSLDTIGWLANDAQDLELVRAALVGAAYAPLADRHPRAWRLGVCRTHEWSALDAGGLHAWENGERALRDAGVALQALELPADLEGLLQAQKTVMAHEAARSLADDIAAHGTRLGEHLRALADTGRSTSDAAYAEALALVAHGRAVLAALFGPVDAVMVPAATGEAPAGLAATGDPVFSRVWTALGLPCVSVPGLLGPSGLPVGLQWVGGAGADRRLLEAAASVHRLLSSAAPTLP